MNTNNESPAALLPCSCGKQAHVVTRDVEPQNDPWYGKRMETFVICECGVCLFDGGFHDGFSSEVAAVEAWNRRASAAPVASESRGSVPVAWRYVPLPNTDHPNFYKDVWMHFTASYKDFYENQAAKYGHRIEYAYLAAPTPPAVSNEEGAFTARVVEWKGIRFGVPAQIAKSFMAALEGTNGESPDWAIAQAFRETGSFTSMDMRSAVGMHGWIMERSRELARSAAAKGEGQEKPR